MEDLLIKVKNRIDEYLEFDSSILFEKCDYLEIFGGAVRDSIADMEIHDIDILALPESSKRCCKILELKGYEFLPEINGKDIQSMYSEIHYIFEPWNFMNKNFKRVQIIRPTHDKEDTIKNSVIYSDYDGKPIPNFKFVNSSGFFETMKQVDLSCCGVSYNGKEIKENFQDAILHCRYKYYVENKNAKMYNPNRCCSRKSKLSDRGWVDVDFLNEEEKINFERLKKLEYILDDCW